MSRRGRKFCGRKMLGGKEKEQDLKKENLLHICMF
jgi:hypothetical protein